MVTITLTPELEQAVTEQAQMQGTTPEMLALDTLNAFLLPTPPTEDVAEGTTLADALTDYIGAVSTKDKYPQGSSLSEDTGCKFGRAMLENHQLGKL